MTILGYEWEARINRGPGKGHYVIKKRLRQVPRKFFKSQSNRPNVLETVSPYVLNNHPNVLTCLNNLRKRIAKHWLTHMLNY